MKVFIFLLFIFVLGASVGMAQRITIKVEQAPLENIFSAVTAQTGYLFLYSDDLLQDTKLVSITAEQQPLDDFLAICLKGQPLSYKIVNKTVVMAKREAAGLPDSARSISGIITNDGKPLENVSVLISGTTKGTSTDVFGRFTLRDLHGGETIIISRVGYETKSFIVGRPTSYQIELILAVNNLDQPVIIAYGATTKKLNTGNVGKVSAKEIGQQPVSNPLAAMQGRVAGVFVQQSNGMPGSAFTIQIRGINSLRSAGNDPLYIVDGVPYPSASPSSSFTSGIIAGGSSLFGINPSDIQSIEILKDADATAIYGSRGANGVVLITTKKGADGALQVEFNASTGVGKITRQLKMMDRRQYLDMRYEAYKNDNRNMSVSNAPDLLLWDTTRSTDWQKELIGGNSSFSNIQVNASGGSKQTQFVMGGGYLRETTVYPGDDASRRVSVHSNIRHSSADKFLTLDWTTSFVQNKSTFQALDLTRAGVRLAPVAPKAFNDDGSLNWENGSFTQNPFAELKRKYLGQSETLVSQLQLSLQILKRLRFTNSAGYTSIFMNEKNLFPQAAQSSPSVTGSAIDANSEQRSWIVEPQLHFEQPFLKGKMSMLAGATFQQRTLEAEGVAAAGFTSDALLENFSAAPIVAVLDNRYTQYNYNALFARLNFEWDERFIINATGRRDGSSRFGPGKQFANFGAIGAAWIFCKGNEQSRISWLSFGKLRGSYGITGSDLTDDYGYYDLWTPTEGSFLGVQGLYPNNLFNPDFAWETNKKLEIATELGFFKNKVLVNVSAYRNRSSNQLVGMPVSGVTGFDNIQSNLGATVENKGLEIELNASLLRSENFTWSSSFNISFAENKLISFPGIETSSYANAYIVGEPLSVLRLYHGMGVDPATGVYVVEDVNKDGNISSPEDNTMLLHTNPDYFGGWQHTVDFKNFELSFLFQFVKQKAANIYQFFPAPGTRNNQPAELVERWQKEDDISPYQRYTTTTYSGDYNDYGLSDAGITDASFIRLKNLSLSYSFLSNVLERARIKQLRVFVQAQNLWTITDYKGMDPENGAFMTLPPLRVITGGLSVNF